MQRIICLCFCPSGPNYTHYKNAQFDKYYEQSQQTSNDSLRMELYKKMDALIMEDAPVIVLYYDQVLRFVSKKIVNMDNNAMNLLILKKVKKINN
jgi:oligopeptide transport system substrate-binding protein